MVKQKCNKEDAKSLGRNTSDVPLAEPAEQRNASLTDVVAQLQQSVGNCSTRSLVQGNTLQTKLQVGLPGDRYEQEADRVADKIVGSNTSAVQRNVEEDEDAVFPVQRMPRFSTPLQRTANDSLEYEEEELEEAQEQEETLLQAKFQNMTPPTAIQDVEQHIQNAKTKSQPLSLNERAFFEPRFKRDFSNVRIHTGTHADIATRSLKAQAFTAGRDIYFSSGRYPPKSVAGHRLLAHELTHTAQQNAVPPISGNQNVAAASSPASIQTHHHAKSKTIQRSTAGVVGGLLSGALAGAALGALVGGGVGAIIGGLLGGLLGGILGGVLSGKKKTVVNYVWKDQQLKSKVDGSDSVEDILTYINSLDDKKKAIAIADLEQGRVAYVNQKGDKDAIEKMGNVLKAIYLKIAKEKAPGKVAPEGGWSAGSEPAELLKGTRKLTKGEKKKIKEASKAKVKKDPITGKPKQFVSKITGKGKYEDRIRKVVKDRIIGLYNTLVKGKGPAEHADPTKTKLHSWDRLKEIANIAKKETDVVFQSYTRGKELKQGTNLIDRWEKIQTQLAAASPEQKKRIARKRVWKIIQIDDAAQIIHDEHNADPSRTKIAKDEKESENAILLRIRNDFAAADETRLLEIHRGWPGAAGGGKIYLQRFKESSDLRNRWQFWKLFQTMIHEYLHTVTHKDYYTYVKGNFGHGSAEYYTLVEGINSIMTEIAWKHIEPRKKDKAIREKVEGKPYAALPFEPKTVPDIKNVRYSTHDRAMEVVRIAGINNVYAAYFLGKVKLIGG